MLWNAVKGFIKDKSIACTSDLNKTRLHNIQELENKIAVLEQNMHSNATSDLILQRETSTKDLNQLLRHRADFFIHRTRQSLNLNSARPSHLHDFKHCFNYIT